MLSPPIELPKPNYVDFSQMNWSSRTEDSAISLQRSARSIRPSYGDVVLRKDSIEAIGRIEADLPRSLVTGFHHASRPSSQEKLLLRPDGTSVRRPNSRATDTTNSREEYFRAVRKIHYEKERAVASRGDGGGRMAAGSFDGGSTVSGLDDGWASAATMRSHDSEGTGPLYARDLPGDAHSDSIFVPRGFSRSGSRRIRTASLDQGFKPTTGPTVSYSMKRPLTAMSILPANGQTVALNSYAANSLLDSSEADIASCYDMDSSTVTSFTSAAGVSVTNISNSLDDDRRSLVHKLQSREARSNLALLEPKFQHRAIVNTAASDIKGRRQVVNGRKPKIMVHPFASKDVDHTVKIRGPMSGSRMNKKRPEPTVDDGQSIHSRKFVEEPGIWGPGKLNTGASHFCCELFLFVRLLNSFFGPPPAAAPATLNRSNIVDRSRNARKVQR
jgi:hypothetical protein